MRRLVPAPSVYLTEPTRFDGDLSHLAAVAAAVDVPVMRKDFLVDPVQISRPESMVPAGVLLIIRMLSDVATRPDGWSLADELGMFVLLEAFDEDDLSARRAFSRCDHGRTELSGSEHLGVDASDLKPSSMRFRRTAFVSPRAVFEDADDVRAVDEMGYEMALVGSALMSADDPGALIQTMRTGGGVNGMKTHIKICGFTEPIGLEAGHRCRRGLRGVGARPISATAQHCRCRSSAVVHSRHSPDRRGVWTTGPGHAPGDPPRAPA